MMHSAEGETRELAVASLERAVANLQRVEKGAARLDSFIQLGSIVMGTLSPGFAVWVVAAGSRGKSFSSFTKTVRSVSSRRLILCHNFGM